MTSLYGYFQYFDNSLVDSAMRMYYQQETGNKVLPSSKPSTPLSPSLYFLETRHPNFMRLLRKANMDGILRDDPQTITLFLLPEDFLAQYLECDLSLFECRKLVKKFWFNNYYDPSFLFTQSPTFDLRTGAYNEDFVRMRMANNGKMVVLDSPYLWLIDLCGPPECDSSPDSSNQYARYPMSQMYMDSSRIFYELTITHLTAPYPHTPV